MMTMYNPACDVSFHRHEDTDLTINQVNLIRTMVNIAREHQVKTIKRLKELMIISGYTKADSIWAIRYWANNMAKDHHW